MYWYSALLRKYVSYDGNTVITYAKDGTEYSRHPNYPETVFRSALVESEKIKLFRVL